MKIGTGFRLVVLGCVLGLASAAQAADGYGGPGVVPPSDASGGYIVVTRESAPVLAAPAEGASVLEQAADGDVFPYESRTGGWYHVVLGESRRGWVSAEAAAVFFYPEYLFDYEPPEDWTPPTPFWVPPAGWVPPPNWHRRSDGWHPPPRWRPFWWGSWFDRHDRRWDDRRRDWDRDRDRDWHRDRGRDWDRDRNHDWDRDRSRDGGIERR